MGIKNSGYKFREKKNGKIRGEKNQIEQFLQML